MTTPKVQALMLLAEFLETVLKSTPIMRIKRRPLSVSVIKSTPPIEATNADVIGSAALIVSTTGADERENSYLSK